MHPTRTFPSPDDLAPVWADFKASLKERAKEWPKVQYVGRDGEQRIDYPKLPLTLEGFYVFCYEKGYGTVKHYFENKDGYYNDFGGIVSAHTRGNSQ